MLIILMSCIIIILLSYMDFWKIVPWMLSQVFRKKNPHLIGVKPNDNNQIIIKNDDVENETSQWIFFKCFYKVSGSKMDKEVVKLAFEILEMREKKKIEEKEKRRLFDWMDIMTEKLDQLMQK